MSVADLPEGGGRTSRLRTLVSTLVSLGHDVEIWNEHGMNTSDPSAFLDLRGKVRVSGELGGAPFRYVLGQTERAYGFRAIGMKLRAVRVIKSELAKRAARTPIDLVVFNNLSFYDIWPVTRLARRMGARTVQCYEDERLELLADAGAPASFSRRLFGLNAWMADRHCSRMADALLVISTYLQQKYERLSGHPERVHLIPTIVDCRQWELPPEGEANPATLFYAGVFAPQDDFDALAGALGRLKAQGVPFRLLLAGCRRGERPCLDRFLAECARLGMEADVEVLGFLTHEDIRRVMARSHLLINLRRRSVWSVSGLSTKLSEYLASGRAVLTTDVGDNGRYVEHLRSAFVVPTDVSADQLAEVLRLALTDGELRRRVGAGGRRAAESHFDVPVIRERLQGILAKVFARPPA